MHQPMFVNDRSFDALVHVVFVQCQHELYIFVSRAREYKAKTQITFIDHSQQNIVYQKFAYSLICGITMILS